MFIMTGSLTSSSALKGFYLAMLHHGDIQNRIQNEIDLVIGHDRTPSLSDRAAMPYTEAAILETLRFGCIGHLAVPHVVTEDVTFRGHLIPKDSTVSFTCMIYCVYHFEVYEELHFN
jgi:cytochrome P450